MFKITKSDTYSWPVKVKIPTDGGRFHEETFDAVFKRHPASFTKELASREDVTDQDFAKQIVVGFSGIVDDSGAEIPFSESALNKLLEVPAVASALVIAYLESASGQGGGAKRKN